MQEIILSIWNLCDLSSTLIATNPWISSFEIGSCISLHFVEEIRVAFHCSLLFSISQEVHFRGVEYVCHYPHNFQLQAHVTFHRNTLPIFP